MTAASQVKNDLTPRLGAAHQQNALGRDSNGMLRWWDVQSEECVMQREGHQGVVQSLRINPNTQTLAICREDKTIKLWDMRSAELLRTLRRDRPYERLNITGTRGLTEAQRATLQAPGAIEVIV